MGAWWREWSATLCFKAPEIQVYIPDELREALAEPIVYKVGVGAAYGIDVRFTSHM